MKQSIGQVIGNVNKILTSSTSVPGSKSSASTTTPASQKMLEICVILVAIYFIRTITGKVMDLNKKQITEKTSVEYDKAIEFKLLLLLNAECLLLDKEILADNARCKIGRSCFLEISMVDGDRIVGQVTSFNLNSVYFSSIDSSSVSGTWLLPPVPTHHGQLFGRPPQSLLLGNGVVRDVHVVDAEHGGGVVGHRCQVPVKQDPPVSDPATVLCQVDHQLHTSPPLPVQSPNFSFMVMYSAMETNLESLESRFDIHLRIPAEFEKVFEDQQKIVDDADASHVKINF